MSTLNHYFCWPFSSFNYQGHTHSFSDLAYIKYFSIFHLQKFDANHTLLSNYFLKQVNPYGVPPMHVILCAENQPHLAWIYDISPSHGEVFYLQALLQHRPSSSHVDAWTDNGTVYNTYQKVATQLGLFVTDKEGKYALLEAIQNLTTPWQLPLLFVHLLVNNCIPMPMLIWENLTHHLSCDQMLQHHNVLNVGIDYVL